MSDGAGMLYFSIQENSGRKKPFNARALLAGDGGRHTDRLSAGPLGWPAAGGAVFAGEGQRLPDHWRVPEPKNHSAMS